AESLRDEQEHPVALALEQRIRGHRGAHLDLADPLDRHGLTRLHAQKIPDSLDAGVSIGLGIVRENLTWMKTAFRITADDVSEGSTAVDPEIPTLRSHASTLSKRASSKP